MDPVSHQHRSLDSTTHGQRVPVKACPDVSGLSVHVAKESDPAVAFTIVAREPVREADGGVDVDLLVVPNASRTSVVGRHGDRIKVRVTGPPEKNKANRAVIELLAEATGAKRVTVTRGRTGRHKTVFMVGVTVVRVQEALDGS